MHRFPNPSSTIENFVAVFTATFEQFGELTFGLDDIVQAAVSANLATSSGQMGASAIARSTRKDRSRDPLYNQMKMYAELFRSLGWLRSTNESALKYTFTLLGRQVIEARDDWKPIFGECVLGIAYPNHALQTKHEHHVRPFATMLRTMLECDHLLSRDEMILGPLNAASDRKVEDLQALVSAIRDRRRNPNATLTELDKLGGRLGIQVNTMRNYTRWPLAVLVDLGWATKVRVPGKGRRRVVMLELTNLGKEAANYVSNSVDLRANVVHQLPPNECRALSRHAHFAMLGRAGFLVDSLPTMTRSDEVALEKALATLGVVNGRDLLFSPFQSLSSDDLDAAFPARSAQPSTSGMLAPKGGPVIGRGSRDHLFLQPKLVPKNVPPGDAAELQKELRRRQASARTLDEAAREFVADHGSDAQSAFYPLVAQMLTVLGFPSKTSRVGVNYQRWDASVQISGRVAPIEIKSPSEEEFISTKAVRQAIENKVILLARKGLPTTREMTSLIVGYKVPNERGELANLIDDVYSAFGFNIGVLDLYTLTHFTMRCVNDGVSIDEEQLECLRGFLSV